MTSGIIVGKVERKNSKKITSSCSNGFHRVARWRHRTSARLCAGKAIEARSIRTLRLAGEFNRNAKSSSSVGQVAKPLALRMRDPPGSCGDVPLADPRNPVWKPLLVFLPCCRHRSHVAWRKGTWMGRRSFEYLVGPLLLHPTLALLEHQTP